MNKLIRNPTTYLVILLLILLLINRRETIVETVTTTDTIIKPVVQVIDNTKPTKIKKILIKDTIFVYDSETITDTIYKDKEVSQYKYLDTLSNGIINEVILADKIYSRSIKLTTFDKTVYNNTIKTVVRSDFYFGGTVSSNFDKRIHNVSLNAFYTHKGKFLVMSGVGIDVVTGKPNVQVGIGLKW